MAEIVNLGRRRKAAAREKTRKQADANAARFGRTKAERAREEAETARAARELDGRRRDDTPPD